MKQNNPPKRITSTIINALKGGVVPRVGLEYITVGREREISALLHDIDIIADGGAAFRLLWENTEAAKASYCRQSETMPQNAGLW